MFFQTFGMHYVKHQNEEGKEVTTAYICEQHTHNRACQLCEMVMEGRARYKGNKAMEERLGQMRATHDIWLTAYFQPVKILATQKNAN